MDHDEAAVLLTDLMSARLTPEVAASVQAHADTCSECKGVCETYVQIRDELEPYTKLPREHPEPARLIAFATGEHAGTDVRDHVAACPDCAEEFEMLRRAGFAATSPRRKWRWREILAPRLRPAMAVVLLALVYPAYLGVVQVPELRDGASRLDDEIQTLRQQQTELRAEADAVLDRLGQATRGGAAKPLVLHAPRRGTTASDVPVIQLATGQLMLPIYIEDDRFADASRQDQILEISIHSDAGGSTPVWNYRGVARELWSHDLESLTLLVPTHALPVASYHLRVSHDNSDLLVSRFRIESPSPIASPSQR